MAINLLHPRTAPRRVAQGTIKCGSYCALCERRRRRAERRRQNLQRDLLRIQCALARYARASVRCLVFLIAILSIYAVGGMLCMAVSGGPVH